jgi:hypothetical protein
MPFLLGNPRIFSPSLNDGNNLVDITKGPVSIDDSSGMQWTIRAWTILPVSGSHNPYRIQGLKAGEPLDLEDCQYNGGNGTTMIAEFIDEFQSPAASEPQTSDPAE